MRAGVQRSKFSVPARWRGRHSWFFFCWPVSGRAGVTALEVAEWTEKSASGCFDVENGSMRTYCSILLMQSA